MAKGKRAKNQDHFEIFSFACLVCAEKILPLSTGRLLTWEQLLGILLTQGSSTDRGQHTLSSPLYSSNRVTCILMHLIRQDYILAVNWEMSTGREACAVQQYGLSHTLWVKTQPSFLINLDFHKELEKMWQEKKGKWTNNVHLSSLICTVNTAKLSSASLPDINIDQSCPRSL